MKNIYTKIMTSNKSPRDYRTSSPTKCNGAILKTRYKLWWQNQNQTCANIRDNNDIPNHHDHAHSRLTHVRTTSHSTNLTIEFTLFWISIEAWNSPSSMRAVSIWPFKQAYIRAVSPFYQHTISTHQTTIHTQYTGMLYTIIELLLHRPTPIKAIQIHTFTQQIA